MSVSMVEDRVLNVKPIKKSINCGYCKKDGHSEDNCWQKKGFPFSSKPKLKPPSPHESPTKPKSPPKKKILINKSQYCKNFGHLILEYKKLKYKIESLNSGNSRGDAAKDAGRSLPPRERPNSPVQRPGQSGLNK
ncbi:hypothetical protein M0804_015365 [Polistes exclamans]|nr:hypothetical protein M0804_015365 [Polistes exclamans]